MNKPPALRGKGNAGNLAVLAAGGVIGALVGVGAAYVLMEARESRSRETGADLPILSSGAAVRLGVLLFGLLRQIGDLTRGR
ncbi:MAG: hypothetical protein JW929_07720 [Anaerolineales bacterium]|nr:hypothetical protein [Anaerolineales bacterium]